MNSALSVVFRGVRQAWLAGADLLFPRGCAACDAPLPVPALVFCAACCATLQPLHRESICVRCAMPRSDPRAIWRLRLGSAVHPTCDHCEPWPDALSQLHAPFEYGGALADAIIRSKWQARFDLIDPLAGLLVPSLRPLLACIDRVVPVPLHGTRLRQRGYNQAALLAQAALFGCGVSRSRLRGLLVPDLLRRTRPDPPAKRATIRERRARTQGAFAVASAASLRGLRVLVVDDVVTTGATLMACAQALQAAGATSVVGLALARVT